MFEDMSLQQHELKVSIFKYIPDLAGDQLTGLSRFIADEFKKEHGVSVTVEAVSDPYDLKRLTSKHLTNSADAYDVMEVDTVMLGELAKSGNLQVLEKYFEVTKDVFTSSAVESVRCAPHLKPQLYGVPTLQCAKFLMELTDVNRTPEGQRLLKDGISFDQLKEALDREDDSGHRVLLVGDFRGRWGLPTLYLDAYVSKHGKEPLLEDIDGSVADLKLIEELKEFTDCGRLADGSNPGIDGKFHEDHELFIREVTDSEHILMYAYSENMAEALQRAAERNRHKSILHIISPPLQSYNLLTYIDAVVVNKHKFADPKRAADIIKFVDFYTSLPFRTSLAFGQDLPPSVLYPRYVLPARKDFFTKTAAANDVYYKEFHAALKYSTAVPNCDIYYKRPYLQAQLEEALGLTPEAQCLYT